MAGRPRRLAVRPLLEGQPSLTFTLGSENANTKPMSWLIYIFPGVCIVAGGIAGLCRHKRIATVCAGMLCGLLLTLLPYVALRLSGALRLSYGNGRYCIEPAWGGQVVGNFWLVTGAFQQVDVALCRELVPTPARG